MLLSTVFFIQNLLFTLGWIIKRKKTESFFLNFGFFFKLVSRKEEFFLEILVFTYDQFPSHIIPQGFVDHLKGLDSHGVTRFPHTP